MFNTIKEFIKNHNLPFQPVEISYEKKDNKTKKILQSIISKDGLSYKPASTDSLEIMKKRVDEYDWKIDSKVSIKTSENIMVLDIDWLDDYRVSDEANNFIEYLKTKYVISPSTSKVRGLHIYFKPSLPLIELLKSKNNGNLGNRYANFPYPNMEILSGSMCWENINSKIINFNNQKNLLKMSLDLFDKFNINYKIEKPIKLSMKDKKVKEAINNLGIKKADLFEKEWKVILGKIKNEGDKYIEDARIWSKLSSKYQNDKDFDYHWKTAPISGGLLSYNDDESKQFVYEDFYPLFRDNYVINLNEGKASYYIYNTNTNLWVNDSTKILLKSNIGLIMNDIYKKQILLDGFSKALSDKLNSVNNSHGRDDIANLFIQKILETYKENIKFDNINHLYQFKDKTFNLKDLTFRDRLKEDYSTITACVYKQREDCLEDIDIWNKILVSTFTEKEKLDNWKHITSNSFSGSVLEKFIVENGVGSNGKSMLNESLSYLHKDYYYEGNVSTLTKKLGDNGNPALANMNKKRLCVFSEPSERDVIDCSMIKVITGKSKVNARKLFSNETETILCGVKKIELNAKLPIDGDTGYSMGRRIIAFKYSNIFKPLIEIPKNNIETNIQVANPLYKNEDYISKIIMGLFWVIFDYMKSNNLNYDNLSNIKFCKEILDESKTYVESNNNLLEYIKKFCDYDTNEVFIKIEEIHSIFKDSEEYNLLTRKAQREYGRDNFIKKIKIDPQLKHFYKALHKNDKGKPTKDWLMNYKLKEEYITKCVIE